MIHAQAGRRPGGEADGPGAAAFTFGAVRVQMTPHRHLLQCLSALVGAVRAGAPLPAETDSIADALSEMPPPEPPWPDHLVGRPCAVSPTLWHLAALADCCSRYRAGGSSDEVLRARLVYHVRQIAHLVDPSDARLKPSVSVVIPVWNRARIVNQAIDSCLSQAERVEIVVVDDGSTDGLENTLAPFSGRIRVLRQENRGVSVARRTGVEAATGDFVHFLDSDDFLLPQCVKRKLAAFAAVPDAGLCYGGVINYDPETIRRELIAYENPDGGPLCPTTSLMAAAARRMPFLPSVVMMPRWLLLEIDAFGEGLRRGEDVRLWFSLALRGIKALGLAEELTLRRNDARSLGRVAREPTCSHEIAILMNLCDLVATPHAWHLAFQYLNLVRTAGMWEQIGLGSSPALAEWRSRTVGTIRVLGELPPPDGLSVLPLLVLLLAGLRALGDDSASGDDPGLAFHREMEDAIYHAARHAPALGDGDAAAWLTAERTAGFDSAVAARLAELAGEWADAGGCSHLLPAVRMLLNLASPDFDSAAFRTPSLRSALSRHVVARPPGMPRQWAGRRNIVPATVLRLLPGGRERVREQALGIVDRLLAATTPRTTAALSRGSRMWHLLETACSRQARPHLDALREALDDHRPGPDRRPAWEAKVRLHARAFGRSLGSSRRAHRPAVTLVVAVTDADNEWPKTVASCLAQTHDRIEIVVAGEMPETIPRDVAARVRFIPLHRPAAANARNVGMAHGSGDFIMFVDPGSTLAPDCVAAHLAALEAIPGSELAVALPGGRATEMDLMSLLVDGGSFAAERWMAPRWLLLETGPIDRWLGDCDMGRYAFRLALRRPNLARVDGLHMARNSRLDESSSASSAAVGLLVMADLLMSPALWRHCAAAAAGLRWPQPRPPASSRDGILLALVEERLRNAVRDSLARPATGTGNPPSELRAAVAAVLQVLDAGRTPADQEARALGV